MVLAGWCWAPFAICGFGFGVLGWVGVVALLYVGTLGALFPGLLIDCVVFPFAAVLLLF